MQLIKDPLKFKMEVLSPTITQKSTVGDWVGNVLLLFLLSRYWSEAFSTYVWAHTNYIWAIMALVGIGLILWPLIIMISRQNSNLWMTYWPIWVYLVYLALRTNYDQVYSLKCSLSELIVWFIFIFTREAGIRNSHVNEKILHWTVFLGKISILIGISQIIWCIFYNKTYDALEIYNQRPVTGIFDHPTSFILCNFIFIFFFIKKRDYLWLFFAFITCLFTGTRSPFVAMFCASWLILKSAALKAINWKDIAATIIISCAVYGTLIALNINDDTSVEWNRRESQASLQWRINFWQSFLKKDNVIAYWLGHGVGSADYLFDRGSDRPYPPHNDFVRIYYDTGLIGLFIFINLMLTILKIIKATSNVINDYVLMSFIVILCFCVTDNFIYFSYSVLIIMFLATSSKKADKMLKTGI